MTHQYGTNISKLYLFKLSLPIFFSNIAIPLVGLVDTALMGHMSSENFLAAISIATTVITMFFFEFWFFTNGYCRACIPSFRTKRLQ